MKSRYIPKSISTQVHQQHFFECAWCGVKLTERHHLKEFSQGGENILENLILLCPTCHAEVHTSNGQLKTADLVQRKSTHLKGDRISGNLQLTPTECKIKMGGHFYQNFKSFLSFDGEDVLSLTRSDDSYLLNCKFFDEQGDLIFWMSKNRYWAPSNWTITFNKKSIEIKNEKDHNLYLKIWQEDDYVCVLGSNYRNGKSVVVDSEKMAVGSLAIVGSGAIIRGTGENSLINVN